MKILIVGSGAQGSVIDTELVKNPKVSEVRLADIDFGKVKWLAGRLKSEKVSSQRVNANNPEDLLRAAKDVDVVVNSTLPTFNLKIMDAALRSGAHYQDLACGPESVDVAIPKQLKLSGKWEDAGLTALINTGLSPGITNVLAAYAADRLDRVDEIRIRFGDKTLKESKEYISMWCPEVDWALEEPVVFENGKFRKVPLFSGEEVYTFPDPVGPQTVFWYEHEEVVTLAHFIGKGLRYVDLKGPIDPVEKTIYQLGLLSDKPIDVKGVKAAPRDVFLKLIPPTPSMEEVESKFKAGMFGEDVWFSVVDVKGEKAGEKLNYILYNEGLSLREIQERLPGANPVSYVTGVPAAILAGMLGKGEIKTRGVIAPEFLEPEVRERFLAELAEKGIKIRERVERYLT